MLPKLSPERIVVILLGVWTVLIFSLLAIANSKDPVAHAIISMGWGLIILWVFIGGALMYFFRDAVRKKILALPFDWKIKFVVFSTILACLEECVTVTMTNTASFFGVTTKVAHITASTNYFDVVFFHSVIMFIPFFIGWAFALKKYDIRPFPLFLMFGVLGWVLESLYAGTWRLFDGSFWIFVYGLMVYLPGYSVPETRETKPFLFRHYFFAFFYSLIVAMPFVVIFGFIINVIMHHPPLHF